MEEMYLQSLEENAYSYEELIQIVQESAQEITTVFSEYMVEIRMFGFWIIFLLAMTVALLLVKIIAQRRLD